MKAGKLEIALDSTTKNQDREYSEYFTPKQLEKYLEQRGKLQAAFLVLYKQSGFGFNVLKDALEDALKRVKHEEKIRKNELSVRTAAVEGQIMRRFRIINLEAKQKRRTERRRR